MSRKFSGRKSVKVNIAGHSLNCVFFTKGLGGKPSATCTAFPGKGSGKKAATQTKTKKKSSKRRSRSRS